MKRAAACLTILLLVAGPSAAGSQSSGPLFFTDNGTDRVSSADLDGTNLQTLMQLTANPMGRRG